MLNFPRWKVWGICLICLVTSLMAVPSFLPANVFDRLPAFARAIHVNLTARWWLSQACLPLLAKAEAPALVFTVDDLERAGGAYWGGYGVAQHALVGLIGMLQAELGSSKLRVSGLQPGPMRTPLRAKAYLEEGDRQALDPAVYADACVALLSSAGEAYRGRVWAPPV